MTVNPIAVTRRGTPAGCRPGSAGEPEACGVQPVHRADPSEGLAAELDESAEPLVWVRQRADLISAVLLVALRGILRVGPGQRQDAFQQTLLPAEGDVDRIGRHACCLGDRGHRGAGVAVGEEQVPGRGQPDNAADPGVTVAAALTPSLHHGRRAKRRLSRRWRCYAGQPLLSRSWRAMTTLRIWFVPS